MPACLSLPRILITLLATLLTVDALAGASRLGTISQDALLARQRAADESLYVLDVRTPEEFVAGHVPGAVNIRHDEIAGHLAEVPKDRDVVLYCRTGGRTLVAAGVLADNGYTRLYELEGNMEAWEDDGRSIERPHDPDGCAAALAAGMSTAEACAP
jgi:rhodanese-related sulfurtransferase